MEMSTILIYVGIAIGIAIGIIAIYRVIKYWIDIYNKFQYWITRAERKFADIDVVMQERIDKLYAIAQIVKKYDIHEYKVLKDTIEARSRWSKDLELNEKVKIASQVESNFLKLQAVFEKYPQLKADALHHNLISKDDRVESRLRNARLGYNRTAQKYNERVRKFPRNIVAWVHHFKILEYLDFEEQESYKPKQLFDD